MSSISYLLDENVDTRLRKAIRQRYPDVLVWQVGDPGTPALKTPDPEILVWCEAHGFTLITNNRASMPAHLRDHLAAGGHVPGIFVLNVLMSFGETADELALIAGASEPDEYYDLIQYLPLT